MAPERRNDIGQKCLGAVISMAVIVIMGGTYYQASGATEKAQKNEVCIATIQATQNTIVKALDRFDSKLDKVLEAR